jgi:hypothetical protein
MTTLEELEESPMWEPLHRHREGGRNCHCSRCDERHGKKYPYKRMHRFLHSRIGNSYANVLHEYINLDWIDAEYRTHTQLAKLVETNTFLENGEVFFYARFTYDGVPRSVIDTYGELFYVHPKTRMLCYKTPDKKKPKRSDPPNFVVLGDYHQLIKTQGKWYEVKGEPVYPQTIVIDGLHYREVKSLPTTRNSDPAVKFRILDGKILVPIVHRHWTSKPLGSER